MEPTKEIWQCFKCETLNEGDICFICGTLKTDVPVRKKAEKRTFVSRDEMMYTGGGYSHEVMEEPSSNKNGLIIALCALIIVVFLFIIGMLTGI